MTDNAKQLYEGMFLINPSRITSNIAAATQIVQQVLDRAGAEVVALYKWDERRLAYEIEGQKRGVYMLAYFRVDGSKIAGIERDVNLSEQIMRCMLLRADHLGEVEIQSAIENQKNTQTAAALQGEDTETEAAVKSISATAVADEDESDDDTES